MTGDVRRVLLTGATGYIGGRLGPWLLDAGYTVRCVARDAAKLAARPWTADPRVERIACDAADEDGLAAAMTGCDAAYYLIHSMMATGPAYRERDRMLAERFARAASRAGLPRIIYLGGLGELGAGLSEHLTSRRETEAALAGGTAKLTVLRAAMIIGSGSASFEILRYLVERLPVMVTPRWVGTESQPIAVRNVLHYLVACLSAAETIGATLDIGGPDILSYREIMNIVADALGLRRRLIIPVPVLTPRLSSLWIHLVTPISHRIARPLAEGLRNRVVCRDERAARLMPQPLLSVRDAVAAALGRIEERAVTTRWADAGAVPGDPDWAGGAVYEDRREVSVEAPAEAVFCAVARIGGDNGYYAADWLWQLRGALDRLVGGPGLRRGRRHPADIAYGDTIDFWRVAALDPNRRLTLRAEMRLPGEALLEFEVLRGDAQPDACTLRQTARFKPRGLAGVLYWYAVLPLHGIVFHRMLQGIRRAAERLAREAAVRDA